MNIIRSALFHSYLLTISLIFLFLTLFAYPRSRKAWPLTRRYLEALLWGLANLAGVRYRLQGTENLPSEPCLIASGQQSTWENMAMPLLFSNPAVLVKSELFHFPVAGWISRNNHYVRVARDGDIATNKRGLEDARREFRSGRNILVFPEGTRNTLPGDAKIRKGTGALYAMLQAPCVPVAVNSGKVWPFGSLVIRPGLITVRILKPIPPGLDRKVFDKTLKSVLDKTTLEINGTAGD